MLGELGKALSEVGPLEGPSKPTSSTQVLNHTWPRHELGGSVLGPSWARLILQHLGGGRLALCSLSLRAWIGGGVGRVFSVWRILQGATLLDECQTPTDASIHCHPGAPRGGPCIVPARPRPSAAAGSPLQPPGAPGLSLLC